MENEIDLLYPTTTKTGWIPINESLPTVSAQEIENGITGRVVKVRNLQNITQWTTVETARIGKWKKDMVDSGITHWQNL